MHDLLPHVPHLNAAVEAHTGQAGKLVGSCHGGWAAGLARGQLVTGERASEKITRVVTKSQVMV